MDKYNIEGKINFFDELYKSLDIDDNDDDYNKCLITNELLIDNHVILDCNHKFNYIPLYNDLINHKLKFNYLESTSGKLYVNEIRCPYCRQKQTKLLPYYEELGLKKVNGVNFFDPSNKICYNNSCSFKCEYKFPNANYDISKPETDTNQKYILCNNHYSTKILIYNSKNPQEPITYDDNNYYCYKHKKEMIKKYKLKEKEDLKIVKQKEKEDMKIAKKKEKEDLKIAKKKEKEDLKGSKKKQSENIVLGPIIIENQTNNLGCIQILKTGQNKGNPCGCKIVTENMCKRHYSLNNKDSNISN